MSKMRVAQVSAESFRRSFRYQTPFTCFFFSLARVNVNRTFCFFKKKKLHPHPLLRVYHRLLHAYIHTCMYADIYLSPRLQVCIVRSYTYESSSTALSCSTFHNNKKVAVAQKKKKRSAHTFCLHCFSRKGNRIFYNLFYSFTRYLHCTNLCGPFPFLYFPDSLFFFSFLSSFSKLYPKNMC